MCGRYGRRADKQRITEWMHAHNTNVFDDSYLAPSYNVTPRSFQPVVRMNEDGARELQLMRWGLVPAWAKSKSAGFSPINAKAETIATSPMFREALSAGTASSQPTFFTNGRRRARRQNSRMLSG